jgi:gamma-glutamylcyclotransferase (GGCT)/AIG2-like uncharacterized protein YtfP
MPRIMPRTKLVTMASARRDQFTEGPNALFVYGTLQFGDVLNALLGRIPVGRSVSAPGWRAAALENRLYPGLVVAEPDAAAAGLLLTDLSNEEWMILDSFEDDKYALREVTLASGECCRAYVWPVGDVQGEDWDADEFVALHLQQYTARCARISARLASGVSDAR